MRAFCSRYTFHFNALRNYLRKLERRPKWQHIRFTYDILSFLWSVQPLRVTPAYTGEKHCACFRRTHSRGSPPRMRGKAALRRLIVAQSGITPAHAGKSWWPSCQSRQTRDHPRACGEKSGQANGFAWDKGSPPRMRGKEAQQLRACKVGRITPAHAGKSGDLCLTWCDKEDHPRACGEKRGLCGKVRFSSGSPPRMRGKDGSIVTMREYVGITPAHAGKRIEISVNKI